METPTRNMNARLNQVPENAAAPGDMVELLEEDLERNRDLAVTHAAQATKRGDATGSHRQHDETAIRIDRPQASWIRFLRGNHRDWPSGLAGPARRVRGLLKGPRRDNCMGTPAEVTGAGS